MEIPLPLHGMRFTLSILLIACAINLSASTFKLFEENGKVGMKNEQGQVVLPPTFEALGWSDGSFSMAGEITGYKLNGRWGLINLKKEYITKAEFESITYSGADRVIAQKKISAIATKTGCLTLAGKVSIPFAYDAITIHGLRAVVMEKQGAQYLFGLVDLVNKPILPLQYKNLYPVGSLRFAAENNEGKLALFSDTGKIITDFFIDSIGSFYRDHAIVFSNGLQGLINREGDIILQPQYQKIELADVTRALQPSLWKVISIENKELKSLEADIIHPYTTDRYRVVRAGKQGLINRELNMVWPFVYDAIEPLQNNMAAVKKNGRWGMLNADAQEIIPLAFDSVVWDGRLALIANSSTGKTNWSLLNIAKDARSNRGYGQLTRIDEHFFLIARQGFYGLLNEFGQEVLHCVYDSILEVQNNQVSVKFKGKYGIVTTDENWLLAPQPNPVRLVNHERYLEQQPGNIFLKSFTGDIIYFTPNPVQVYPDYLAEAHPNNIIKKVDWSGVEIKFDFDLSIGSSEEKTGTSNLNSFHDGLQLFEGQGKFGFRDTRNRLIIPNRYDSAKNFSEQRAAFKLLGKWGYLDTNDKIIVNPTFDFAGDFVAGHAIVIKQKKFGLIDKTGAIRIDLQYDSIIRQAQNLFIYQNRKIGLAAEDGRMLVQPRYDALKIMPNHQLHVKLNESYGIISMDGLNIIPIQYDSLEYDPAKNVYLGHQPAQWVTLLGL